MPELPEVETMRRGILPTIGGRIRSLVRPQSKYRPLPMSPRFDQLKKRVIGLAIKDVRRLGKRVVVDLSSGDSLVFQPKMAGLLLVGDPPTPEHVRVRFLLDDSPIPEFTYWDKRGLGGIYLWSPSELDLYLGSAVLGPDALAVDRPTFQARFADVKAPIKPALLDQKKLAGIGNLYASEILHAARIDPHRRCCDLSTPEWKRIHHHTQRILLQAIDYEGSTLSDGSYRNAHADPGSYQNEHLVYDREALPCLSCKRESIQRTVQMQRSTFFCPRCQV